MTWKLLEHQCHWLHMHGTGLVSKEEEPPPKSTNKVCEWPNSQIKKKNLWKEDKFDQIRQILNYFARRVKVRQRTPGKPFAAWAASCSGAILLRRHTISEVFRITWRTMWTQLGAFNRVMTPNKHEVVANSKVINMWVLLIKLNWIKQSLKWDWSCVTSAKHSASCLHLLLVGEEASSLHQLVDPPN